MDKENLMALTAEIVSAHVSNNSVASGDVGNLIRSVYGALSRANAPAAKVEPELVPAVSIRSSVKNDAIACLQCGKKMKMLKRHLFTDHSLTPAGYKARWSLPADYPIVAPEYAKRRADLAVKIGLGRKRQVAPSLPEPVAVKPEPERAKVARAKPAAAKQPGKAKPAAMPKPGRTRVAKPKGESAPSPIVEAPGAD